MVPAGEKCAVERGGRPRVRHVGEGDVLSCRGLGKCVLEEVGNQTKKGRVFITLKRYL